MSWFWVTLFSHWFFHFKNFFKGYFASAIREKHKWPLFNDCDLTNIPLDSHNLGEKGYRFHRGGNQGSERWCTFFFFFNVIVNDRTGVKPWLWPQILRTFQGILLGKPRLHKGLVLMLLVQHVKWLRSWGNKIEKPIQLNRILHPKW